MARQGVAWRGRAWPGMAGISWHGKARRGMAWQGVAWHGMARRGRDLHKIQNQKDSNMNDCLDIKFTGEPGMYDFQGNCYFKLTNGETLKISAKDSLEVVKTVMDITSMPFNRDEIVEQIEESLDKNGYTEDKAVLI